VNQAVNSLVVCIDDNQLQQVVHPAPNPPAGFPVAEIQLAHAGSSLHTLPCTWAGHRVQGHPACVGAQLSPQVQGCPDERDRVWGITPGPKQIATRRS
jgi:hypothetical protein